MHTTDLEQALAKLWRELADGDTPRGASFILNSGDVGLLRSLDAGELTLDVGFVSGQPPRDRQFRQALADERDRLRVFLGGERVGRSVDTASGRLL